MAKEKYKINPISLEVEKFKKSSKERLYKIMWIMLGVLLYSVIIGFIALQIFPSSNDQKLKSEISNMEFEYTKLNDRVEQMSIVLGDIEDRDDNVYRLIFESEPISQNIRNSGIGGADRYAQFEGYSNSDVIINSNKIIDNLARRLYIQSLSLDELFELSKNKSEMQSCIPAIQPINKNECNISSGYGYRIHPYYKTTHLHTGIDFSAKTGTEIHATGDGVVIQPKSGMSGYGLCVIVDHGFGYKTLYAHMSEKAVTAGQKVKRGEVIGYVGCTGMCTGPHLHYEVIKNGNKINPIHYFYNDLSPEEYDEILEISKKATTPMS